MDITNEKELEEMINVLKDSKKVRRAGSIDRRGNISLGIEAEDTYNEEFNISLNHVCEYYMYDYYFKPEHQVKVSEHPYGQYFRAYGDLLMKQERFKAAEAAYKDAICWNPVDLDSILALAESYKHQNMMDKYLLVTRQAYRYCPTRATMARYYRNMGFYYTSRYKPHVARVCYLYSNIYFHTENADNELQYLEQALKDKTPDMDIPSMQKLLIENDIEAGPDADTIGIIYRVGELMLQDKEYGLARDCFSIVYDITREKALEDMLNELEEF